MSSASSGSKRGAQKRDAWMIATGLAAGLLIWFALANSEQVDIHFWVVSAKAPLIVVIVVSALLGALILTLWRRSRRHPHSS